MCTDRMYSDGSDAYSATIAQLSEVYNMMNTNACSLSSLVVDYPICDVLILAILVDIGLTMSALVDTVLTMSAC